jgi:ABC-type transport system involved in cytochrome c biogenesis ATPase subunit
MTKTAVELDLGTDLHVLRASNVGVHTSSRYLLAPTSLILGTGEVVVAVGEPGQGHTALALTLAGRLRPDHGAVSMDDTEDGKLLRRMVALVDVPGVSAPDGRLPLATVVAEELAMAGLRSGRRSVRKWLRTQGLADLADVPIDEVTPGDRTRVLAGLAACRAGIRFLVLVLPERLGGQPATWMSAASALAEIGFGVLVTASPTTAAYVEESLLAWIGSESL